MRDPTEGEGHSEATGDRLTTTNTVVQSNFTLATAPGERPETTQIAAITMIVGDLLMATDSRRGADRPEVQAMAPGTRAAAVIYANGYDPKDGTLAAIELHGSATPVLHQSEPRALPSL